MVHRVKKLKEELYCTQVCDLCGKGKPTASYHDPIAGDICVCKECRAKLTKTEKDKKLERFFRKVLRTEDVLERVEGEAGAEDESGKEAYETLSGIGGHV